MIATAWPRRLNQWRANLFSLVNQPFPTLVRARRRGGAGLASFFCVVYGRHDQVWVGTDHAGNGVDVDPQRFQACIRDS